MTNNKIFHRVISLGSDCQPSFQINHLFGKTREIFDWLVTPHDGLLSIIETDGKMLGLSMKCVGNGTSVLCRHYNVLYHHEFARDSDGMITFDTEQCANIRSKLKYKMQRFIEECQSGKHILFVRRLSATDIKGDRFQTQTFTSSDLNCIASTIEKRYPKLAFNILFVTQERPDPIDLSDTLDERIKVAHLPRGHQSDRREGPDDSWRESFSQFNIEYLNKNL